ncbi:MAG: hypothetical protein HYT76_01625 [Deltaproteobacteria bacterium]|nr:hypothetical protein [Deltaproteobacteria bacterium]
MSRALRTLIGGITLTTIFAACSSDHDSPALADAKPTAPPDAGSDAHSTDLYIPPMGPAPIAAVLGRIDDLRSSGDGRLFFLDLQKRTFLKNPVFEDWFCSPLLRNVGTNYYVANGNYCDSLQVFNQESGEEREIDLDEGRVGRSRIGPIDLLISPSGEGIYLLTRSALFLYDPTANLLTQKLDFTTQYSPEENMGTMASRIISLGGLLYIGVSDFGIGDFSFGVPQRSRVLVVNPRSNPEAAEILASVELPFIAPVSMKAHEETGRIFISCAGLTELDRRLIRTGGLTYLETETLRVDPGIDDLELEGIPGDLELADEFGFLLIRRPRNIDIDHPYSEVQRFQPYPFRMERVGPVYRDLGPKRIADMKWRPEIEQLLVGRRSPPAAIVFVTAEGDINDEVPIPDYPVVAIE